MTPPRSSRAGRWFHHSKTGEVRNAYHSTLSRAQSVVSEQTRMVHLVHGFQLNFDTILEQELASIREAHKAMREEADQNRQKSAVELRNVEQYVETARTEAQNQVEQNV